MVILTYPWETFEEVKFNSGELLNFLTINNHLNQIYDNIIYINNNPRLDYASTTVTGMTVLATSAEIINGTVNNRAISTSAFNTVLNSINVSSTFNSVSSVNITNSLKMIHGSFTATSGISTPIVEKIEYGTNAFSSKLISFMLYPQSYTNTPITSSYTENEFYCYRYSNNNDITDYSVISAEVSGYLDDLNSAYIVYYNLKNDIQSIKWSAIGI